MIKRAVCCACAQHCGLRVEVTDGGIARISGDPEHPTSRGFVCVKGANAHRLHHDPTRVHRPLKRVGPRGGGEWEEIEWEQALDEIAETLLRLASHHGPETVAYSFGTFHGADWGLGERFMNLFGSPNTVGQDKVCYAPNALGEALTYGFGPTFYTDPVPGTTRCMVVWGLRPSASMPLLWRRIVAARRAGAKLIVVDPLRTHEAEKADLWLQNRPGTDTALALGLVNCLIVEGLYDEAVAWNSVGFDDLARRAAEYPPARVSELTWVPEHQIVEAARTIGANGPMLVHGGNGLCQSGSSAVQAGRALACLIALTGNVGIEGGHRLAGPPQDVVANGNATMVDALPPEQRAKRLGAETFPYLGRGYEHLDRAISGAWGGHRHALSWLATAHEPTLWRAVLTGAPYPVKALILQHHNALGSGANARAAAAALTSENLELLVVHELFVNATSRLADYLLPASHWLEKPFFSVGYGYMGFSGDYVEAKPAVVDAEHEHRSDYDLWRDLGRRLGQEEHWPQTAEEFWQTLLTPIELDFQSLSAQVGPLTGNAARSPRRATTPTAETLGTPTGKIELRSSLLESWGLDPLPDHVLPAIFDGVDDRFPLVLTTGGRRIEGFHQNAQQMPWFRRKHPHPIASVHPDTAAELGICDGHWIRIETPRGAVEQRASVTDRVPRKVVHADRWWYPERADDRDDPFGFWSTNINVCTEDATESCDPVFGSWLLRGLPCRISRAAESPTSE